MSGRLAGPDGFVASKPDPLHAFHAGIDAFLDEASRANDPHACRVEALTTGLAWVHWLERISDSAELPPWNPPAFVHAVLQRIWRIDGLGPRALDEGGVRGWNSIGWLSRLIEQALRRLPETRPSGPPGFTLEIRASLSTLIRALDAQGDRLHISVCSRLPELFEWIEAWGETQRTGTSGPTAADGATQAAMRQLLARFQGPPPKNTVWKQRQLRRVAESLSRGLGLDGPLPSARILGRATAETVTATKVAPTEPPDLIDARFVGRRVRQLPLARHLRAKGWRFPLQGAWDPGPHPSVHDTTVGVRAELRLGERDPSDLHRGGSSRWVTLGELRVWWEHADEEALRTWATQLLDGIAHRLARDTGEAGTGEYRTSG